ncbi:TRAP transporter large permease [Fusobacterium perfoetens]|uniref:TRAP transporter large permease n=1 Tax=Fusobacterium perfoetens TaxID=852 RepID=UPI0004831D53|nr:TRAP transporter large permease [Fusobacterium perfoetens]MCI6152238.1 TRAP transporter large permease [Fusobacterium perfoetens]MDY3237490.1 TRAP transporter large permease [Fusobacterium perfoetens]
MEISIIGLVGIILLVFLFLKVPVFISILAGTATYFILTPRVPQLIMAQRITSGIESIPLLAIPFFVCAGVFMNYSGVTQRIMEFCTVLTGRMTGGLAQVNVLLSTLMGGLSGSNLADAAMEAKMLVPEMEKKGFSKEFSSVVTATSAMITPLIPPGIGMILYGSIANVSIGKLFVSGIGVGTLLCVSLMILVHIMSKKRGYLPIYERKVTKKEFLTALKGAALPLCLPIIIIGGIRIGLFTPTEAGSVAIIYSLILGFVYKELDLKKIIIGIKETVITTSTIMLIVGAAAALSWVLTKERVPQQLTDFIVNSFESKYAFLIIVNIFLILVGMFIEGNAITIILVPLFAPIALKFGIDPIQFAMIFIFNVSIGTLSPPMGTLMFVTCGITKCKIKDFIKEAVPFYILLVIVLILLTFIPHFSTLLVELFY